jgi:hypothetical protein
VSKKKKATLSGSDPVGFLLAVWIFLSLVLLCYILDEQAFWMIDIQIFALFPALRLQEVEGNIWFGMFASVSKRPSVRRPAEPSY